MNILNFNHSWPSAGTSFKSNMDTNNNITSLKNNNNTININQTTHNTINIATHNIQGMNDTNKQIQIIEEIKNNEIHIIGLSETNLNHNIAKYIYKNNSNYLAWFSRSENDIRGSGMALIM